MSRTILSFFFSLAQILKSLKDKEEKQQEDQKDKEKQSAEDMVAKLHGENESQLANNLIENTETVTSTTTVETKTTISENTAVTEVSTTTTTTVSSTTVTKTVSNSEENQEEKEKSTTSLAQKTFNIDDLRRRTTAILNRDDPDKKDERMTRLKSSQLANGTYLFKLGMENQFKSYVNQFATNIIALNKPQRNEERDKKRHLSHKFSLTTASEFKWAGGITGHKTLLTNTLRQTILQLEQAIQSPFMHPNWHIIRKHWLNAVGACQQPRDFARALIVLQACIKPVVFANVWHEQLGHVKLVRITAAEREERKKIEKREKKEREEEEERNRMIISGYVKYTMGFKHQLWKQKGEEYRIHGRWGWLWLSSARVHKIINSNELGLAAGPQRYMVQIRDSSGMKILSVDKNMYSFIQKKVEVEGVKEEKDESENGDNKKANDEMPNPLKNVKIVPPITEFEEIDVSKALTVPGRILFPKVAARSRLDDFLQRRIQLKILEERKIVQQIKPEEHKEEENVDVENDEV